eukprot:CAMPEP_0172534246 /NCGR_PEP_ID=MMETSP1067-20121228/6683_1 /TAXON_ID=265564 ORGANISM="Thalassiosira punctigera, Strain Tpunct2005C2" /NCGR_SAMPLE_ID=MMETSP1067 /ASSEMBLY_ACC=CAM_ASM_000444 /LENGTH=456 /DNA_ID=CAMNT_0013319019 /DNA_START=45 /DNA_END=1415 /DNA_ORIENTATION=-
MTSRVAVALFTLIRLRASSGLALSSLVRDAARPAVAAPNFDSLGFNAGSVVVASPPAANVAPPSSARDWPAMHDGEWLAEAERQVAAVRDPIGGGGAGRSDLPIQHGVVTGRDRRAGWESYAPAGGAPKRRGAFGGVVGTPSGVGDWRFTSGFGPATTDFGGTSDYAPSSSSPSSSAVSMANGNELMKKAAPQREVITGRERRASFSSFDMFAPAHETNRKPGIAGASIERDAAAVAATLSAMPSSPNSVATPSDPFVDVTETEVPMDTPARRSLPPHLSLRPIPGKGLGVITDKAMVKGEFIGEYHGEVMSEEVKDRRYLSSLADTLTEEDREWIQSRLERGQTLTGCYLYGISLPDGNDIYGRFARKAADEDDDGPPAAPKRIYVDAEDERESLWTRFINHASPPHNNVNPKSVHESWDGQPRVWFMANRDIEEGEELCFDYGEDYWLEGDEVY